MVLKRVFIVGSLSFIFALQGWGQASGKHDTILANYELVQEFQEFTLGGKLSNNSLSIYPREINDTDNFWFDFQTTAGKDYYYVMPAAGKREPLFDKSKMAMQLSEFTKGVVDKNKLDISSITFSKDQRSFEFDYKGKQYSYNRLTGKLTIVEKKEEKKESSDPSYTWMNFSPDKKYILYAKNHNLYVKGNKSLGVDTTEVQLTTDGMKDFSYAREDDYEPAEDGEVPTLARWCPDNRHVYAVRDDNRLLRDFWVINSIEDSPSLVKYKYEFPGDKYVTQNDLTIIDIVENPKNIQIAPAELTTAMSSINDVDGVVASAVIVKESGVMSPSEHMGLSTRDQMTPQGLIVSGKDENAEWVTVAKEQMEQQKWYDAFNERFDGTFILYSEIDKYFPQ